MEVMFLHWNGQQIEYRKPECWWDRVYLYFSGWRSLGYNGGWWRGPPPSQFSKKEKP